jgi:hypothetical protein
LFILKLILYNFFISIIVLSIPEPCGLVCTSWTAAGSLVVGGGAIIAKSRDYILETACVKIVEGRFAERKPQAQCLERTKRD